VTQRRRVNRQGRIPTTEKYLDDLKDGKYDSINYDHTGESVARSTNRLRGRKLMRFG
jgi:hypothetical protein